MLPTRNDIPGKSRADLVKLLNTRLVDLLDLRSQVKQAHWNIKGPGFHALHLLLDEVAEAVDEYADEVAERAVQLGGYAEGTARITAAGSSLPEYPSGTTAQMKVVEVVSDRLAATGKSVRAAIEDSDDLGDKDTADIFTEVSRGLDKWLWFVESHLQPDR